MIGSKELLLLQHEEELAEIGKLSKKVISENAQRTIQLVLDGEINPLKVKIACKTAMEYFDQVDKGVKEAAITEAKKYEKNGSLLNASVQVKSDPSKIDFSQDPVWKELHERMKKREALLKVAASTKSVMFDDETGECDSKMSNHIW
jgi:hypothetical protein